MHRWLQFGSVFAVSFLTALASAAEPESAAVAAGQEEYIRLSKTEAGKPKGLDTAIVRYVGRAGTPYADQKVDLVGVVHIGQDEYYTRLDEVLGEYDVVLYELVAPDGTRIKPEDLQERRSVLASIQTGMKDMLNLEYQLEKIDYMAKNFRHADMSPEEFVQDMERRGDSLPQMIARMMGASLAIQSQNQGGDVDMLRAMFSSDRAMLMKRAMASQLVNADMMMAGITDPNGEDTIIRGRNAKALKILREELDAGKETIAVFYGAGHLEDMADRLEEQFQMIPQKTTWLQAWDLQRN